MKSEKKTFYHNTIMQYLLLLAQYVLPLLTLPYLTRVLEADLYGIITFLTAIISYFQILIDFGYNLSATKDIAERQTDKQYIGIVLGRTIQGRLYLLILSFAIYVIFIHSLPLTKENLLISYLYFGIVVFSVFMPDFLFRGLERTGILTVRYVVSQLLTTALTFLLIQTKEDIIWIPILRILGLLLAFIMTWYYIKKKLHISIYFSGVHKVLKSMKVSAIYFISTFATTAFGITNTFLFGIMNLPSSQIAYWGVSYTLISAIQSLYSPITSSLYPHMAARRDFQLIKRILISLVPINVIAILILFQFSKPIIVIVSGLDYIDAVPIFRSLLPVLALSFPAMLIGFPFLGIVGRIVELTASTMISAAFHILGLFFLIAIEEFNVLNVAILRSLTELMLLGSRIYLAIKFRNKIQKAVSGDDY